MSNRRLIPLLLLVIGYASHAAAQCVMEPIEVAHVEGYVLSKGTRNNAAEVQLIVRFHPKKGVKWVQTDANGHFAFNKIKPGHYLLEALSNGLIPGGVDITITKPNAGSTPGLILVVLDADGKSECGGDSITLVSKEKMDQVLRDADGDAR